MSDPLDDKLLRAGQQWRSTQPDAPEPDQRRWVRPARRWARVSWGRGWFPVAAAAIATAVVAVAGIVVLRGPEPGSDAPLANATSPSPAAAIGPVELIVRDGAEVAASGTVVAPPGEPMRFCVDTAPMTADFRESDRLGIPRCDTYIPVTGVDLGTLSGADTRAGHSFGRARLRGVWQSGTLAVTEQSAPVAPTLSPNPTSTPPPCPVPTGGWRLGGGTYDDLHRYVYEEHPEQFSSVWMSYPAGFPAETQVNVATVMVVEVVSGDVEAARRELASRYDGNLCVVSRPGLSSIADLGAAHERVKSLTVDGANMIVRFDGGGGPTGKVGIQTIMLTPGLYDALAKIGFELLEIEAWLIPVE